MFQNNEPSIITEIKTDTLFVDIPMVPDTVYKIKTVTKKKPTTTIYAFSKEDSITLHNTFIRSYAKCQVDSFVGTPEHLMPKQLAINGKTFVSEKTYDSDYVNTFIRSYAKCQVDSFECRTIVNWQAAFEDKIYPEVEKQFKKERKKGRIQGLIIGTTGTLTSILLFVLLVNRK